MEDRDRAAGGAGRPPGGIRLGIDLGGHKIAAGIVRVGPEGLPVPGRVSRRPTPEGRDPRAVVDALAAAVLGLLGEEGRVPSPGADRERKEVFVGVAVPAMLDAPRRRVLQAPNFPGWEGFPLPERLASRLEAEGIGARVRMENDANGYLLGEVAGGAARGMTDAVLFTLGTGIGGGVLVGGRLVTGFRGMGGEIGHLTVADGPLCGCGGLGHVEACAAADGIERSAREAGLPGDVAAIWANPSPRARALRERVVDALGRAVANVTVILDPEAVILGGGISRAEGLVGAVRAAACRYLPLPYRETLDLRLAALGAEAAILGAASLSD